jgi:hypothetical protein
MAVGVTTIGVNQAGGAIMTMIPSVAWKIIRDRRVRGGCDDVTGGPIHMLIATRQHRLAGKQYEQEDSDVTASD